jgi:hypothetical protein
MEPDSTVMLDCSVAREALVFAKFAATVSTAALFEAVYAFMVAANELETPVV